MRYGYDTMQKVEKQLKLNNLFILNYGPDFCLCQKAEKYTADRKIGKLHLSN